MRSRLKEVEPDNPQLVILVGPNYVPSQADIDALDGELRAAQQRAGEPPSTTWDIGWGARGIEFELRRLIGGRRRLPPNTPTIDDFSHGVVTSIKSIDLNAQWYRNAANLSARINRYVSKLAEFDGLKSGSVKIGKNDIDGRVLDIVIPLDSGTPEQEKVINESAVRARRSGVLIQFNRY